MLRRTVFLGVLFAAAAAAGPVFDGGAICADNTGSRSTNLYYANPPGWNSVSLIFDSAASTLDIRMTLPLANGSGTSSIDDRITQSDTSIPEPATLALTGVALIAFGIWKRLRINKD